MKTITIFDPALCCSSGVCGPDTDPTLTRVAADVDWLKRQGVQVVRHNLAQEPMVFANTPAIKAALEARGSDALPVILADGLPVMMGAYPDREEFARIAGIAPAGEPQSSGGCCGPSGCC